MMTENGGSARKRWLVLALGLSVLFNVGFAAAFAVRMLGFPPPPPAPGVGFPESVPPGALPPSPGGPPPAGPGKLKDRLGLTDDQASEFHEGRKAMAETIRGLRAQVREERRELFKMVATDSPDVTALKQRTRRIAELQKQVQDIVVDNLVALRNRLNADQKPKFDEFIGTDLCGCPMCDGGCMGGGPGPGGQHRGQHRGHGGHGGPGESGGPGSPQAVPGEPPGPGMPPAPEDDLGGCPCGRAAGDGLGGGGCGGGGGGREGSGGCGGGAGSCGGAIGGILEE